MAEKALREIFGEALRDLGKENEKVVVLDADLSSATRSILFGKEFPDRFFNVGIAEANMVSIAAGLSTCDLIPFATTFSFLFALRTTDQIRSQICYPNLNVKIVGTNGGLSGFGDGATHQTTTDISIMNSLPNMKIMVPSDEPTMHWVINEAAKIDGPVFIRVPRVGAPVLHTSDCKFEVGKGVLHREGKDVTIVTTGMMLQYSIEAAEKLAAEGIEAEVIEMITIKPLDKEILLNSAKKTGTVVTTEEHSRYGGLFSIVSETLSETYPVPVRPVAIEDRFGESGEYWQILQACGLTTEHIIEEAHKSISMKKYK